MLVSAYTNLTLSHPVSAVLQPAVYKMTLGHPHTPMPNACADVWDAGVEVEQGKSGRFAVNLLIGIKGGVWLFRPTMVSSLWGLRPRLLALDPNLTSQGVTARAWLVTVDSEISGILFKVRSGQQVGRG